MHPVDALKMLFGPLAQYTSARGAPLPAPGGVVRGGGCAGDLRDPDRVVQAGYLSHVLEQVRRRPGGETLVRTLQAYYCRAGVENQTARLAFAVEDLERSGVRLQAAVKCGRAGKLALYRELLAAAVEVFAEELAARDGS